MYGNIALIFSFKFVKQVFLVLKMGSSVAMTISGVYCSFGFIMFLKNVSVIQLSSSKSSECGG